MTLVRVLGPVSVEHHGRRTPLDSGRATSLLTALAMAGHEWTHESVLIELIWDGKAPRTARQQLHTTVCRLRSQFACVTKEEQWVESRRHGYRLASSVASDVEHFRRTAALAHDAYESRAPDAEALLEAALSWWGGPPADGACDRTGRRGQHLVSDLHSLMRQRATLQIEGGQSHLAIAPLSLVLEVNPYDEEAAVLLAHALDRSGRRADAVTTCKRTARALRSELGVEPGDALHGVFEHLKNPLRSRRPPPRPPVARRRDPLTDVRLAAILTLVRELPPELQDALRTALAPRVGRRGGIEGVVPS